MSISGIRAEDQLNAGQFWNNNFALSAESQALLHMAMAVGNFRQPDDALRQALQCYVDSQAPVELHPEAAASLRTALTHSEDEKAVSPRELRERIHRWVRQTRSGRSQ
jgi:hypothetical protein